MFTSLGSELPSADFLSVESHHLEIYILGQSYTHISKPSSMSTVPNPARSQEEAATGTYKNNPATRHDILWDWNTAGLPPWTGDGTSSGTNNLSAGSPISNSHFVYPPAESTEDGRLWVPSHYYLTTHRHWPSSEPLPVPNPDRGISEPVLSPQTSVGSTLSQTHAADDEDVRSIYDEAIRSASRDRTASIDQDVPLPKLESSFSPTTDDDDEDEMSVDTPPCASSLPSSLPQQAKSSGTSKTDRPGRQSRSPIQSAQVIAARKQRADKLKRQLQASDVWVGTGTWAFLDSRLSRTMKTFRISRRR